VDLHLTFYQSGSENLISCTEETSRQKALYHRLKTDLGVMKELPMHNNQYIGKNYYFLLFLHELPRHLAFHEIINCEVSKF
jgi:hypothetical protein